MLSGVEWYVDRKAEARGEPGLYYSYLSAVASSLQAQGEVVDPTWLMGASGWAFRIIMRADMSERAIHAFDWAALLPEGLRNAGYDCVYVGRRCGSEALRAQRQAEAHAAIVAGIDAGRPAVVYDLFMPEWGLVIGYDDDAQAYDVLAYNRPLLDPTEPLAAGGGHPMWRETHRLMRGRVPYALLGQRDLGVLSVTVPGGPCGRCHDEALLNALQVAVAHAQGEELTQTPTCQSGVAAYAHWAKAVQTQPSEAWERAEYLAGHWAGARCYARDLLMRESDQCPALEPAARAYARVADQLLTVWRAYHGEHYPGRRQQEQLADILFDTARSEAEAIAYLRRCVPNDAGTYLLRTG